MTLDDYEGGQHLHLGYYEGGYDIEGVAFKLKDKVEWHVFFNFVVYGMPVPVAFKEARKDAYAGVHVFTVSEEQIDSEVYGLFNSFVMREVLPLLKRGQ